MDRSYPPKGIPPASIFRALATMLTPGHATSAPRTSTPAEELYREHFGQYGEIETVEIPQERQGERPRGFAFVTYTTGETTLRVRAAPSMRWLRFDQPSFPPLARPAPCSHPRAPLLTLTFVHLELQSRGQRSAATEDVSRSSKGRTWR